MIHRLIAIGSVAAFLASSIGMCLAANEPAAKPAKPANIQVKGEFYELDTKTAGTLQSEGVPKGQSANAREFVVSTIDAAGLKALIARVDKAKTGAVNSPILSVASGTRGTITISTVIPYTDDKGKQISVNAATSFTAQPTLNPDGSITLRMTVNLPYSTSQIRRPAEARLDPGSAMVMVMGDDGSGRGLAVILTAAVAK